MVGGMGSMQYLVARFADGRVLKGTALGLDFPMGTFRMDVAEGSDSPGPVVVETAQLKALFGVEDLDGDPDYAESKVFKGRRPEGAAIVRFRDGERIVGVLAGYDPEAQGFYLVPADPKCNNSWCYVTASAVEDIRMLTPGAPGDTAALGRVGRGVARAFALTGLTHLR
jgi:hypothetical protein